MSDPKKYTGRVPPEELRALPSSSPSASPSSASIVVGCAVVTETSSFELSTGTYEAGGAAVLLADDVTLQGTPGVTADISHIDNDTFIVAVQVIHHRNSSQQANLAYSVDDDIKGWRIDEDQRWVQRAFLNSIPHGGDYNVDSNRRVIPPPAKYPNYTFAGGAQKEGTSSFSISGTAGTYTEFWFGLAAGSILADGHKVNFWTRWWDDASLYIKHTCDIYARNMKYLVSSGVSVTTSTNQPFLNMGGDEGTPSEGSPSNSPSPTEGTPSDSPSSSPSESTPSISPSESTPSSSPSESTPSESTPSEGSPGSSPSEGTPSPSTSPSSSPSESTPSEGSPGTSPSESTPSESPTQGTPSSSPVGGVKTFVPTFTQGGFSSDIAYTSRVRWDLNQIPGIYANGSIKRIRLLVKPWLDSPNEELTYEQVWVGEGATGVNLDYVSGDEHVQVFQDGDSTIYSGTDSGGTYTDWVEFTNPLTTSDDLIIAIYYTGSQKNPKYDPNDHDEIIDFGHYPGEYVDGTNFPDPPLTFGGLAANLVGFQLELDPYEGTPSDSPSASPSDSPSVSPVEGTSSAASPSGYDAQAFYYEPDPTWTKSGGTNDVGYRLIFPTGALEYSGGQVMLEFVHTDFDYDVEGVWIWEQDLFGDHPCDGVAGTGVHVTFGSADSTTITATNRVSDWVSFPIRKEIGIVIHLDKPDGSYDPFTLSQTPPVAYAWSNTAGGTGKGNVADVAGFSATTSWFIGFLGLYVKGPPADSPSASPELVSAKKILSPSNNGDYQNYTIRNVMDLSEVGFTQGQTVSVRVWLPPLKAGGSWDCESLFLQKEDTGNLFDYASTPVEVLQNGASGGVSGSYGAWTDWVDITLVPEDNLVLSYYTTDTLNPYVLISSDDALLRSGIYLADIADDIEWIGTTDGTRHLGALGLELDIETHVGTPSDSPSESTPSEATPSVGVSPSASPLNVQFTKYYPPDRDLSQSSNTKSRIRYDLSAAGWAAGSGTKIRIWVPARFNQTLSFSLAEMWVGLPGTDLDFDGNQIQVFFGGSSGTGVIAHPMTGIWSDWMRIDLVPTDELIISYQRDNSTIGLPRILKVDNPSILMAGITSLAGSVSTTSWPGSTSNTYDTAFGFQIDDTDATPSEGTPSSSPSEGTPSSSPSDSPSAATPSSSPSHSPSSSPSSSPSEGTPSPSVTPSESTPSEATPSSSPSASPTGTPSRNIRKIDLGNISLEDIPVPIYALYLDDVPIGDMILDASPSASPSISPSHGTPSEGTPSHGTPSHSPSESTPSDSPSESTPSDSPSSSPSGGTSSGSPSDATPSGSPSGGTPSGSGDTSKSYTYTPSGGYSVSNLTYRSKHVLRRTGVYYATKRIRIWLPVYFAQSWSYDKMYVGKAIHGVASLAFPSDAPAPPAEVLQSGTSGGTSGTSGSWTDWLDFNIDSNDEFIISIYCSSSTNVPGVHKSASYPSWPFIYAVRMDGDYAGATSGWVPNWGSYSYYACVGYDIEYDYESPSISPSEDTPSVSPESEYLIKTVKYTSTLSGYSDSGIRTTRTNYDLDHANIGITSTTTRIRLWVPPSNVGENSYPYIAVGSGGTSCDLYDTPQPVRVTQNGSTHIRSGTGGAWTDWFDLALEPTDQMCVSLNFDRGGGGYISSGTGDEVGLTYYEDDIWRRANSIVHDGTSTAHYGGIGFQIEYGEFASASSSPSSSPSPTPSSSPSPSEGTPSHGTPSSSPSHGTPSSSPSEGTPSSSPSASPESGAFTKTYETDGWQAHQGYTYRSRHDLSIAGLSFTSTRMRLWAPPGPGGTSWSWDKVYVGTPLNASLDFNNDLREVNQGRTSGGVSGTSGAWTDWVEISFDITDDLVISWYSSSGVNIPVVSESYSSITKNIRSTNQEDQAGLADWHTIQVTSDILGFTGYQFDARDLSSPSSSPSESTPSEGTPSEATPSASELFTPSSSPSESTPSDSPSEGTPSESTPSDSPSEGTPSDSPSDSPSEATPSDSPSEATPSQSPSEATPSESTPSEDTPSEGTPSHGTPSSSPSESTPSEDTPSHGSPSDTPSHGTPSDSPSDTPSHGTPSSSPSDTPSGSPSEATPSGSPSEGTPSSSAEEGTPSDSPSEDTPSEGTPSEATPSQSPSEATPSQSPSEGTPSEGTPSEATPSQSPSEATPSDSPSATPSASPVIAYPVSYDRFDSLPTGWTATGTPTFTPGEGAYFVCGETVDSEEQLYGTNEMWWAGCLDGSGFTPGTSVKIVRFDGILDNEIASVRLTSSGNIEGHHGTVSDSAANPLTDLYEFLWVQCTVVEAGNDGVLKIWYNSTGDWDTASLIVEVTTGNG